MLEWTLEQKQTEKTQILQERIHEREEILQLAERIGQLTTQQSAEERERMTAANRSFRSSIGSIAGGSLLLGLAIAALTLVRMRTLERQSVAAQTELRMLSVQIRTTQEEERKSLSRELHDQVGQMLTGLRMEIAAVSRMQDDPGSEISSRLARAKGTVEQTLGIVRNIAMLLRPSMLDDLGLTPALAWLVKEVSRSSGMTIQAEVDPRVDELPDAHRTCLYRVVQEALTNATRHSGASTVELKVDCDRDWVQACVNDDGKGFEVATNKRKGLGLLGMEERIRELGGNLHVISSLGRGTSVEIRLPRPVPMEGTNAKNLDRGRSRDRADRVKTTP
jgi:signal transduction histidine kinase